METAPTDLPLQQRRQEAMSVLSHSSTSDIQLAVGALALPSFEHLRAPESGLVMVRGRIGGDGAPFNVGEATVSRAAVRLVSGEVGFGYTLGRDQEKATMIALCDAVLQNEAQSSHIEERVIAPLRGALARRRAQQAAETAATKVDFYTLVRGEN